MLVREGNIHMARKDMKGALGASLKAEEQSIMDRFKRAEGVFAKTTEQPHAILQEPVTKVTRDSFTMPSTDYELIAFTKERCLKSGMSVTKSEILRAGLHALGQLTGNDLVAIFDSLEKVKTGRPNNTI